MTWCYERDEYAEHLHKIHILDTPRFTDTCGLGQDNLHDPATVALVLVNDTVSRSTIGIDLRCLLIRHVPKILAQQHYPHVHQPWVEPLPGHRPSFPD